MPEHFRRKARIWIMSLMLILAPALIQAQAPPVKQGAPPIAQPLVNEGSFAVSLGSALAVVTTDDEVEAESRLGELGIAPRNGWIADYPVTPDIVVELQNAAMAAADAGRLPMKRDDALDKVNAVASEFGMAVRPYVAGTTYAPSAASCENYPNPAMINSSYASEGPPIVTYYCPPPDYYYLYAWVPCPFWWADLWFPGFFILTDFHRVVHHHKHVVVISNHFNDVRTHRAFRIDPAARFSGKTFAGIGVANPKNFIPTGVPRSEHVIFNGPRMQRAPGGVTAPPPSRGGERVGPASHGGGRIGPPAGVSHPSGGGERR